VDGKTAPVPVLGNAYLGTGTVTAAAVVIWLRT
jgi:hypothetical protein